MIIPFLAAYTFAIIIWGWIIWPPESARAQRPGGWAIGVSGFIFITIVAMVAPAFFFIT